MITNRGIRAIDDEVKRKIGAGGIVASLLAATIVVALAFYGGIYSPISPEYPPTPAPYRGNFRSINRSITTSFGEYIPYAEWYILASSGYSIDPSLSNVVNQEDFRHLSEGAKQKITENGFVVITQNQFSQIYEILDGNYWTEIPNFITSDAVLHAFHVCYDLALREVEVYSFWDLLGNLTNSLLQEAYEVYEDAPEGVWREAARLNIAYFTVAMCLLDNSTYIHPDVVSEVNQVLGYIGNHTIMTDDWFMSYMEDFTQFVPRGHYTRSEVLSKYFLAMMWLGRVQFRLESLSNTRQAILMALMMNETVSGFNIELSGYDVWDSLYEPTAFFVGVADDPTPLDYSQVIKNVYGANPSWSILQNESLLGEFIETAEDLHDPLILGSPVAYGEDINVTKGMRFMGQRFIPDSYILGQLVYQHVGTINNPRLMPKGLDVMAAFGSERAWELLEDQKEYENYVEQMEMLRSGISNMTDAEWVQNLYYLWLYSLLPLLHEPSDAHPLFMRNQAWVDKQLHTALASWTELRHDTILYAKQSYAAPEAAPSPEQPPGYVEPVPTVYGRLASLCLMMLEGLGTRSLLSERLQDRLETLHSFLLDLRSIAIKELAGQSINETDIQVIESARHTLEYIGTMPEDPLITSGIDKYMSLIADVHTDPNTMKVLEEAVGDPHIIIVAVPINGQLMLARGGTFSYYEFTQPMSDRLTDEAWREILDQGDEPDFPEWTSSFIVTADTEGLMLGLLGKAE
ncbi:DUF3160 domain-containing protein [Candidatus Thorarchaeota archaeon]|nr:MAG: DUF3160 domain-containing protein [Candidatus Thorarchaeota archaeon]